MWTYIHPQINHITSSLHFILCSSEFFPLFFFSLFSTLTSWSSSSSCNTQFDLTGPLKYVFECSDHTHDPESLVIVYILVMTSDGVGHSTTEDVAAVAVLTCCWYLILTYNVL